MTDRRFSLNSHPNDSPQHGLVITGSMSRLFNVLTLSYVLLGNVEDVLIPLRAQTPLRKKSLWETTCFEFFLAPSHDSHYWEFNLSPSGHWNVFHFTGYRQGMEEEPAFDAMHVKTRSVLNSFHLTVDFDLSKIVSETQRLEVAITTILQQKDGKLSYWSLNHGSPHADFHRRDGFVFEI